MARWFYIICAVFISVMSVVHANGCDCTRGVVRKYVCGGKGQCTKNNVDQAQEMCLLRCKRTDPVDQQASLQRTSTRQDERPWSDVTEPQSGDSGCLLDDIFRKLTPVWQERVIKLLKEAASDSPM